MALQQGETPDEEAFKKLAHTLNRDKGEDAQDPHESFEKLDKDDSDTLTVDEAYMLLEKFVDVMAKAEDEYEERKKNATEEAEMEGLDSSMDEELESHDEL